MIKGNLINQCTFRGRVGQDPRFNEVGQDNKEVCNFSLAVPANLKSGDEQETLWVDCSLWSRDAAFAREYGLKKGQLVTVSGSVSLEVYTNNAGETVPKLKLFVENFGMDKDADAQPSSSGGNRAATTSRPATSAHARPTNQSNPPPRRNSF